MTLVLQIVMSWHIDHMTGWKCFPWISCLSEGAGDNVQKQSVFDCLCGAHALWTDHQFCDQQYPAVCEIRTQLGEALCLDSFGRANHCSHFFDRLESSKVCVITANMLLLILVHQSIDYYLHVTSLQQESWKEKHLFHGHVFLGASAGKAYQL